VTRYALCPHGVYSMSPPNDEPSPLGNAPTQNPDKAIWHYMDLAKYVGLISRGLFFALPSALRKSDVWEGSWGELDFTESLDKTVHAKPTGAAEWKDAFRERRAKLDTLGVSCWHESDTESDALWRLYGRQGFGVAVKSTRKRVEASLSNRRVHIVNVNYTGHHGRRLGDDPLVLLSTKRPEFKHESEVRFIVPFTDDETSALRCFYADIESHGRVRTFEPGNRGPLIIPGKAFSVNDSTCVDRGAPAGMHLQTDNTVLLEEVRLAPSCAYSLRRAVIDVTKSFGLPAKLIKEATLDLAPYDDAEFVNAAVPSRST
jgi:hypothetical protein